MLVLVKLYHWFLESLKNSGHDTYSFYAMVRCVNRIAHYRNSGGSRPWDNGGAWSCNTHPLIIEKPMYVSLESLLTRFLSCCWNSRNLTTAGPLHFCERGLPCMCVCVFCPQADPFYSSQSKACCLTTYGPPSVALSSIPTPCLLGGLSSHALGYDQARLSVLCRGAQIP